MYSCVGKWAMRFGDSLCNLLRAYGFSYYRAVNMGNNDIRRRGQTKFITEATEEGPKWARNSLDNNKNIHPEYDQYVQADEAPPLTSQELHLSYKAS
eukprot:15340949-Ditylum_brightwellii.AAC.1